MFYTTMSGPQFAFTSSREKLVFILLRRQIGLKQQNSTFIQLKPLSHSISFKAILPAINRHQCWRLFYDSCEGCSRQAGWYLHKASISVPDIWFVKGNLLMQSKQIDISQDFLWKEYSIIIMKYQNAKLDKHLLVTLLKLNEEKHQNLRICTGKQRTDN